MLINKSVAIYTGSIALVPYCRHHVSRYHEWMKDPDIQVATASEPLSLQEEYDMQRSWRTDSDKLTFIFCHPTSAAQDQLTQDQEIASMVGDVNLFIGVNGEENDDQSLVGEVEIMVAEKFNQRRGFGRAALLTFLRYILKHEEDILDEYFIVQRQVAPSKHFSYLRAKVSENNKRSINLFEGVGFKKTDYAPNFFGEYELRTKDLRVADIERLMNEKGMDGYVEVPYQFDDFKQDGSVD